MVKKAPGIQLTEALSSGSGPFFSCSCRNDSKLWCLDKIYMFCIDFSNAENTQRSYGSNCFAQVRSAEVRVFAETHQ